MSIAAGVVNGQEVIAPYLFGFILVIITLWTVSIYKLNQKFTCLNNANISKDIKAA